MHYAFRFEGDGRNSPTGHFHPQGQLPTFVDDPLTRIIHSVDDGQDFSGSSRTQIEFGSLPMPSRPMPNRPGRGRTPSSDVSLTVLPSRELIASLDFSPRTRKSTCAAQASGSDDLVSRRSATVGQGASRGRGSGGVETGHQGVDDVGSPTTFSSLWSIRKGGNFPGVNCALENQGDSQQEGVSPRGT